jgi:hypothetical protein
MVAQAGRSACRSPPHTGSRVSERRGACSHGPSTRRAQVEPKTAQQRRFLDPLEYPEKHWKFSGNDARQSRFWNDYVTAYEEMIPQIARQELVATKRTLLVSK